MKAEQISIFLENKEGRIAEVTSILAKAKVNIRALSLADTTDFGVLRLIVDNNDKAEQALKTEGFTFGKTDVVAVKVEDKPGGLNDILNYIEDANINVEYMYSFASVANNNAIMIFRFDNIDGAIETLTEKGVKVFNEKDVYTM